MTVLQKIQDIRKGKNISQKKMADLLHISQPGYQKIEQGINVLSLERFLDICRILEIKSYNQLLPDVSADIVEEIDKVLIGGSLAFDNIRSNVRSIRQLLDDLIEKIKTGKIEFEKIAEELEFLENYLAIISKDSTKQEYEFRTIMDLIDKID
jgi:transcriptional regulator with XRE-family HTH domain